MKKDLEIRGVVTLCAVAMVVLLADSSVATAGQELATVDSAALQHYHDQIDRYLAISRKLRDEIPVLLPNSTAREITATSDILAAAVQRARPKARVGDFFDTDSSRVIKERVITAVRTANLGPALVRIDDELPTVTEPRIHLRFPAASQLATMPPALLDVLPRLPPELEYRIIGSYLILRDINAALILDFIPAAVPRR